MPESIPLVDLKAQFDPLKDQIFIQWENILSSMRLFLGPNVQAFEKEFAAYCGTQYAIGVSDGTSAIQLALRALDIGPGDEVITVSHTFIATAEAILLTGASPVFVDIDPNAYTIDAQLVEAAISPRTRAILPVHLYGQCADMDTLMDIANRHHLAVIEDACQAHGATYKGRRTGSLGTIGCFSFYFSKNLGAYGEGGMLTTNDPYLASQVKKMRDHGSEVRYHHEILGWNSRLDEMQAAVLRVKLPHLDHWNERRRQLAGIYNKELGEMGITVPIEAPYNHHVYHLYVVRVPQRDNLRSSLSEEGIGTGIHYPIPIHLQKPFEQFSHNHLPVTESVVKEIVSLPMYPELKNEQVMRVCEAVGSTMREGI
jgi:dTDP-4-amino-4,6-dideoxygalactose transaminase